VFNHLRRAATWIARRPTRATGRQGPPVRLPQPRRTTPTLRSHRPAQPAYFWLADDLPLVRTYILSPAEVVRLRGSKPAEEVLPAS
jgi:hypothetical protein